MTSSRPVHARTRRVPARWLVAAGILAVAVVGAFLAQLHDPSSPPSRVLPPAARALVASSTALAGGVAAPTWGDPPQLDGSTPLGSADGEVPDGTTVFDVDVPAIANLDPTLLAALQRAASDAADDGVAFEVNSAWRSRAYQQQLLQDAVAEYGSEEEAARWVARPERSAHVSGDAIDLGKRAAGWLADHGARYGLCQIYDNERWHYELRPDAADHGCPDRYADAAHDPRLQD